jgi:hypothetical protein
MGFSLVGHDEDTVRSVFNRIEEEVASHGTADISDRQLEILHY